MIVCISLVAVNVLFLGGKIQKQFRYKKSEGQESVSFQEANVSAAATSTLSQETIGDTNANGTGVVTRNETTCLKTETKFFFIPTHEITSDQLLSKNASEYYKTALNEESAGVWLHRGFERMECYRIMEPKEADVFLIAGYLHLAGSYRQEANGYAKLLMKRLYNKTKPHDVLTPTWNAEKSRKAGIANLIKSLKEGGVNLWSVGFERNEMWQHTNANRIIPIPYVVRPSYPKEQLQSKARSSNRTREFSFMMEP